MGDGEQAVSDVSKTNELIAEARRQADYLNDGHSGLLRRLADALEAATRVPVQGEPNGDREALRDEFRSYLGDEIYVCSRDHSAWSHGTMGLDDFSLAAEDDEIVESLVQIASRATVPDAATEELRADKMTAEEAIESVLKRPGMYGLVTKTEHRNVKAERDAALSAVERIREAVSGHPECDRYSEDDVISCGWKSAYASVVAALDGAPEPEVKP